MKSGANKKLYYHTKNCGFSSKYLSDRSLEYFYYGSEGKILSNQDIDHYINIFRVDDKEYFAIFKASILFSEISDSCEKLSILIDSQDEKHLKPLQSSSLPAKRADQVYVIVENIKAKDKFSARDKSEMRIDLMSTLLTLYHHKEHPQWDSECLVVEKGLEHGSVVDSPRTPCIDASI